MIVNDASRVVRMMIVSDTPSCGITYDCDSDDSRGVIYALRVINYAPREHLQCKCHSCWSSPEDQNIFIVQATGFLAYFWILIF
jgi:hypothetical protein